MAPGGVLRCLLLTALLSQSDGGLVKELLRERRQIPEEHNVTLPSPGHPVVFNHVYNINVPAAALCQVDLDAPDGAHIRTPSSSAPAVSSGEHVTEHTLEGDNQIVFTHRINIPRAACGCSDDVPGLKELMSRLEMLEGEVSALRENCGGGAQVTGVVGTKPYCHGRGNYSSETCSCVCESGWTGPNCTDPECPGACRGRGRCLDGKCECFKGFAGDDCSLAVCAADCGAHGKCVDGVCVCSDGFFGSDCSQTKCLNNCLGRGRCDDGDCVCDEPWTGPDCSELICPNDCYDRGRCDNGTCYCDEGFAGEDCGQRTCPNNCHGNGFCVDGRCVCAAGFGGDDCARLNCINDCNGRGTCFNGLCVCDAGYQGADCSQLSCPNNCNHRGQCVNGRCACDVGFGGDDCAELSCPNDCQARGRCVNGQCVCEEGFAGEDCSIRTCPANCYGRGECVAGRCECHTGFSGEDCGELSCPGNCHGRGRCVDGQCVCNEGFAGEDCGRVACPNDCLARGRCVDGHCVCQEGYEGSDCSVQACPGNCNGRGRCVNGRCVCQSGYQGESCSDLSCPNDCLDRGRCEDGRCVCDEGHIGDDCSEVSPPKDLTVGEVTADSVDLSWTNEMLVTEYLVTYVPTSPGGLQLEFTVPGDQTAATLRQLEPGFEYMINVYAVLSNKRSVPVSARVATELPKPSGLLFKAVRETSVEVTWDQLNFPFHGWEIYFRNTKEENGQIVSTLPPSQNQFVQSGLGPGQEYEVSVNIIRNDTRGPQTSKTVTTKMDGPRGVEVKDVTDSSALVGWSQPVAPVDRITMVYGPGLDPSDRTRVEVSAPDKQYSIDGLKPDTHYTVTLVSRNGEISSDPVNANFTTALDAPTKLQAVSQTDDSITLEWTNSQAEVEGYLVKYSPLSGETHGEELVPPGPGDATKATITGLRPGTEYGIGVTAVKADRESQPATTNAATNIDPPRDLEETESTETTLTVTWRKPRAKVGAYRLEYTSKDGQAVEVEIPPEAESYVLTNLTPGMSYTIMLSAERGLQRSAAVILIASTATFTFYLADSDDRELTTPSGSEDNVISFVHLDPSESQFLEPEDSGLGELTISGVRPDGFDLTWKLAARGAFDSLLVECKDSRRFWDASEVRLPGDASGSRVRGLNASTQYEIKVYGIRGSQRSELLEAVAVTAPQTDAVNMSINDATTTTTITTTATTILDVEAAQSSEPPLNPESGLTGSGDEPEGSGSESTDSEADPEGSGADPEGSGAKPEGSGAKSEGSGAKSEGSGAKSEGSGAKPEGSGAKSEGSGAKSEGSGAKSEGSGAKSEGSGAKSEGSGADPEGSGSESTDSRSESTDSGADPESSGAKPKGSGAKPEGSGAKPEGSGAKAEGSGAKPEGPSPLGNLTVSVTSTSLTLTWSAPDGAFDGFLVEVGGAPARVMSLPGSERRAEVEGLNPSTLYDIAVRGLVEGRSSAPLSGFATTEEWRPAVVNLTASDVSWDGFTASWASASARDFDGFVLEVTNLDNLEESQNLSLSGDAFSLGLSGLYPNTTYMVRLFGMYQGSVLQPVYTEATTVNQPAIGTIFISNLTSESFTISWNETEGEFDAFILEIIDSDWVTEPKEFNVSRGAQSHEVTGLRPATDYVAYVYGVHQGTRTSAQSIVASTAEEPDLSRLVVANVTSDRFSLWWRTGGKAFDNFVVEVRESALPSQAVGRTLPGDARSTVMAGLRASTRYDIKLYASGGGQNTPALLATATTEDVPKLGRLSASSPSPHNLSLAWSTESGHFDGFVVRVSDSEQQSDPLEFRLPGPARDLTVSNLLDATGYDIELYGISHGRQTPSVLAHAVTAPLPKVENLTISNVSPYGFRVSWEVKQQPLLQDEDEAPPSGGFSRFLVVVTDSGWLLEPQEFTVPGNHSHLDIWGLITGIGYEVRLTGVSSSGLLSRPLTTVAVTEAEPEVEHLFVSDITADGFRLSWTADEDLFDRYVIKLRDGKRLAHPQELSVSGAERTKVLTGLMSGTEYEIELYGVSLDRRSQPITGVAQTGLSTPRGLSFSDVTDSSAVVHWSMPRSPVDNYRITYVPFEGGSPLMVTVDGSVFQSQLPNLIPGRVYQVTVSAVKGLEESDPSTDTVATALDRPRGLTAVNVTDFSALLVWQPSVATVDGYVITYSRESAPPVVEHVSGNTVEFEMGSLVPASHYTVDVHAVRESQKSAAAATDFTTAVDPPRDLTAANVQTDGATLTWRPPYAAVTGYTLTFSSTDGVIREVVLSPTASSYTMTQLSGSTEYTVRLQAMAGAQRSRHVSTVFTTIGQLYRRPRDCAQLLLNGETTSGVYTVYVGSEEAPPTQVYCDMTTDGGGWIVFLRRQNGKLEFYRNWKNYTAGFGNMNDEFWLGLSNLYKITNSGHYELRVDLRDNGESAYAQYDKITIGEPRSRYKIYIGAYSGTAGDSMSYHQGRPFSTYDNDNDIAVTNCALSYKGAFWYKNCHRVNLMGKYGDRSHSKGINWFHWKGHEHSIQFAEMKLRPANFRNFESRKKRS